MAVRRELPSVEYLNESLSLNGDILYFKNRPPHHFKNNVWFNRWNNTYAGKIAYKKCTTCKYYTVTLNGLTFLAHRIIFKMAYDEEPELIDHIDRNPLNNNPNNLRPCTPRLNSENSTKHTRKENQTLHQGKYRVRIRYNMKIYNIGCYGTKDEADDIYYKAQNLIHNKLLTHEEVSTIIATLKPRRVK